MNTQIKDGGPAFPFKEEDGAGGFTQYNGMTLRDYFAWKAFAGIMSSYSNENWVNYAVSSSKEAYAMADAMLAAREAKP